MISVKKGRKLQLVNVSKEHEHLAKEGAIVTYKHRKSVFGKPCLKFEEFNTPIQLTNQAEFDWE